MNDLLWFYLKYESCIKSLIQKCFKTTQTELSDNVAIFKGSEAFNYEFNLKNLLDRQRLSNFETEQFEQNKNISYKDFNQ